MAKKRMFSLDIIDTDLFLDMPPTSRLLYYELCMRADDDGFVSNPKKIQKIVGCGDDDLRLLIAKKFIIPFNTGIVVITHWKLHNYIAKDRYKETIYTEEKSQLKLEENGSYTKCIQNVDNPLTQIRIDKNSIDKNNIVQQNSAVLQDITEMAMDNLELKENIKNIIDYLNKVIGTNYKYSTKGTINLIKARFNDGYKIEDFYSVIDKKSEEWLGTDMEKYLRPVTLFGNKFENYLNQKNTFKGNAKISYCSRPNFDNTASHNQNNSKIDDDEFNKMSFEDKKYYISGVAVADMTREQKAFFNEYCLAKDENGNNLEF